MFVELTLHKTSIVTQRKQLNCCHIHIGNVASVPYYRPPSNDEGRTNVFSENTRWDQMNKMAICF